MGTSTNNLGLFLFLYSLLSPRDTAIFSSLKQSLLEDIAGTLRDQSPLGTPTHFVPCFFSIYSNILLTVDSYKFVTFFLEVDMC